MAANPFSGGGGFVPAVQKTRLIHAAVRHFITESGQWDIEADGVPICQQDLLVALLGIHADTYDEALALNDSLVEASYAASPEGIMLISGLVALYRQLMPGKAFDSIIPAMVRRVVNPEVADYLQVPDSRSWGRVIATGVKLMRVFERAFAPVGCHEPALSWQ
jgi:hypothetical protein